MKERSGLVKFKENEVTLLGEELQVGEIAPDFSALNADLSEFKLSDLDGKIKVISVVPSLDTRVCELQTIQFNHRALGLSDDISIISISVDLPFAQKRFCESLKIDNLVVVSDHKDLDFGLKYGLVMKELRLLARAVLVLDKDNKIVYLKVNDQVATEPNYDEALDVLKSLV